jgi:hypothetical protein
MFDILVRITAAISVSQPLVLVVDRNRAMAYNLDGKPVLNVDSPSNISKFPRPVIMSPQGQFVLTVNGTVQLYDPDGILLGTMQTSGCAFVIFIYIHSTTDNLAYHQREFWLWM